MSAGSLEVGQLYTSAADAGHGTGHRAASMCWRPPTTYNMKLPLGEKIATWGWKCTWKQTVVVNWSYLVSCWSNVEGDPTLSSLFLFSWPNVCGFRAETAQSSDGGRYHWQSAWFSEKAEVRAIKVWNLDDSYLNSYIYIYIPIPWRFNKKSQCQGTGRYNGEVVPLSSKWLSPTIWAGKHTEASRQQVMSFFWNPVSEMEDFGKA